MKYTIKQSNIATLIHVIDKEGNQTDCFFMADDKQPEAYPSDSLRGEGVTAWEALPLTVRAHVNRQFGVIFSLPYERRQAFIDSSIPFDVEVIENTLEA